MLTSGLRSEMCTSGGGGGGGGAGVRTDTAASADSFPSQPIATTVYV